MNHRPNVVINMLGFHTEEKPKSPCLIMSILFLCMSPEQATAGVLRLIQGSTVALQVPNMDGARTFAVDIERNSVDNCVMIHKAGHYVYGTVRKKIILINLKYLIIF